MVRYSQGAEADAGRSAPATFGGGAIIGAVGGLIGLGGAEFRLPLLIGAFRKWRGRGSTSTRQTDAPDDPRRLDTLRKSWG